MNDHTSKQFDAEMEAIRSGVLTMGGLVERQLARAICALEQDEEGTLLDAVGADEQQINQFQVDIDQQCAQIIARRQPAAVDLRMILTVSKVVNDLERIGDEVKKIAYKSAQARRATRRRCCGWRSTRWRGSTPLRRRRLSTSTTRSTPRSRRSCAS